MLKRFLTLAILALLAALTVNAQGGFTQVTATVLDPTGAVYSQAPFSVTFFDPGTSGKLPLLNGSTFQQSFTGINTNSFGQFSVSLPDNQVIGSTSGAIGTQWKFSICSTKINGQVVCFTYQTPIDCVDNTPSTCTSGSMDISAQLQAVAATLPSQVSPKLLVNGVLVPNPNLVNSPTLVYGVVGSNIQATASGGGGGGGGSPASPANSIQFANAAVNAFASACIVLNCFGVDNVIAPTTLNVPFNITMSGTTPGINLGSPGQLGSIFFFNNVSGRIQLNAPTGIALGTIELLLPPGNGSLLGNNTTNTGGNQFTIDMSAATSPNAFRLPNISSCTPTLFGTICFDTLNGNFVTPIGIAGMITGAVTPGHCSGFGGTSASPTIVDVGACGGGGGGTPGGVNFNLQWNNSGVFAGVANGLSNQVIVLQNGGPPVPASAGILNGNGGLPVTITPYPVKCDNATTTLDRATTLIFQAGASVVNVPDPTTSGCGTGFPVVLIDDGAGTITINRTTTAVFNIANGAANIDGATSFTMTNGQFATLNTGDNVNWTVKLTTSSTTTGLIGQSIVGSGAGTYSTPAYLDCKGFAGADWGLIIQACLTQLNTNNSISGIADARGVANSTTASVNPFGGTLPASGILLLGPGTYLTNVPIVAASAWSISGTSIKSTDGGQGTTIKAGASFPVAYSTGTVTITTTGASATITGAATGWTTANAIPGMLFNTGGGTNSTYGCVTAVNVGAQTLTLAFGVNNGTGAPGGSSYHLVPPVYLHGCGGATNNGAEFAMAATNINFDGNNLSGAICEADWFGQQGTYADNVELHNCNNILLDLEGQFQQSGPWNRMIISPGTGCVAGTIPVMVRGNGQNFFGITNLSTGKGACATSPTIGVSVEENNTQIINDDSEGAVSAVTISGNPTCLFGCAVPTPPNGANGVIINGVWSFSSNGTVTLVHASNAVATLGDQHYSNMQFGGTATNSLIDDHNACTITTNRLPDYIINHSGAIYSNAQSAPTAPCSPAIYVANTYQTASNCSSSTSPAVCGSSAAGSVNIAAGSTTIQVNTTAVTANSQINLQADDTLGTKLGVTCNSTLATLAIPPAITARVAGTSFTISYNGTIIANPLCLSYTIVN